MAFILQDDPTNNSGLEPGTSSRAFQALASLVRVLARVAAREFMNQTAASEFLRQQTNEANHGIENNEK